MQSNRTCISSSVKYLYSVFCISTCDVQTDCLNFTLLNMVITPTRTNAHSVLIVTRPLHQSFISAMILITLVIRYHKISKQTSIDATLLWVTIGRKKMRKKKKNEQTNGKEQLEIFFLSHNYRLAYGYQNHVFETQQSIVYVYLK